MPGQPHPHNPDANPRAAPFLKWAGGKNRLLRQFARLFPPGPVARYFEPFVGSGAVFFHLRGQGFAREYSLADVNPELINVYTVLRDDLAALIEALALHKAEHAAHARNHYYRVRDWDRQPDWAEASPVRRAARMIYLNKTCYNGLWRVNSKGHFNVPLGRYHNPPILDEPKLRAASSALAGVRLGAQPFDVVLDQAGPGDFVYFDPPYVPLSSTANFTSYTRDAFEEPEQRALAETFQTLDRQGVRVMLSNADAPLVHSLYAGFRLEQVRARRAINSRAGKRGPISEVVVLNY